MKNISNSSHLGLDAKEKKKKIFKLFYSAFFDYW